MRNLLLDGMWPVPGEGKSIGARLMFVAEIADMVSCTTGQPFSNIEGDFLHKILKNAGIDREQCYFTYLIKCCNKVGGTGRVCGENWLKKEILECQAEYIVSFGRETSHFFLPKAIAYKDCVMQIYNNVLIAPSLFKLMNGSKLDVNRLTSKLKDLYGFSAVS